MAPPETLAEFYLNVLFYTSNIQFLPWLLSQLRYKAPPISSALLLMNVLFQIAALVSIV
jgi:hypothetical protein